MACSTHSVTRPLALALLLAAAPALADDAAAAKKAAKAAKAAFDLGRFGEALAKYEEAYRLKAVPGLLFNLGQCHRQLGHTEQALHFFKQYLESGPPAAQAKATREVVDKLEVQLGDEKKKTEETAARQHALELEKARADAARVEEERERARREDAEKQAKLAAAERERAEAEARRRELEASLKPPAEEKPSVVKKWWFWTAIGAAAAGAATGIAIAASPKPTPTTFKDINAR